MNPTGTPVKHASLVPVETKIPPAPVPVRSRIHFLPNSILSIYWPAIPRIHNRPDDR